jgi:type IV secretory pathway VirB2 component (pilin)
MTTLAGTDLPDAQDLAELRTSARGWHGVQLAVLGFIGLCGALQGGGSDGRPGWVQDLSFVLVLVALVLACSATVLVASAAWPVYGGSGHPAESPSAELRHTGHRLRTGIAVTFVAVACLAVATSAAWWPTGGPAAVASAGLVEVRTGTGVACGVVRPADPGNLALDVDGQVLTVALSDLVSLRQVDHCP